ncbi:MAG: hypothetical protein NZ706_06945, partial [Candidatus Caldatribacterium sp.]|nr:hypothetical protein [Candidatus Caldatribacterium sp.]
MEKRDPDRAGAEVESDVGCRRFDFVQSQRRCYESRGGEGGSDVQVIAESVPIQASEPGHVCEGGVERVGDGKECRILSEVNECVS